MSENGPNVNRLTVELTTQEVDVIDLALRMLAQMAERGGEAESWEVAAGLADRLRKAASVREWT
jgi:hypothetical protein